MGIGGHMLGEKKLRQLRERTGLSLDRAYRRGQECEGRVVLDGVCQHFSIRWETGEFVPVDHGHWTSCPGRSDG